MTSIPSVWPSRQHKKKKRKETVKHPTDWLITILQNDSITVKVVQLV